MNTQYQPKILIVENSQSFRKALTQVAEKYGEVETAKNGKEAVIQLQNNSTIDLIITDYHMRRKDGYQLAQYVVKEHADIPIIMITTYANKELAIDSLNLNIFAFLEKPCSIETIEDKIQTALEQRNREKR